MTVEKRLERLERQVRAVYQRRYARDVRRAEQRTAAQRRMLEQARRLSSSWARMRRLLVGMTTAQVKAGTRPFYVTEAQRAKLGHWLRTDFRRAAR